MTIGELNEVPFLLEEGKVTRKEAIGMIASFIIQNPPLFTLNHFDEDFKEDIILTFFEKGSNVLDAYNKEKASFYPFLFSTILTLINTKRKNLAIQCIKENVNIGEGISFLEEKEIRYKNYSHHFAELKPKFYDKDFQNIEKIREKFNAPNMNNFDKKILVLAMKSSYYITDRQIKRVCELYNIEEKAFYAAVQYCKTSIQKKRDRRAIAEHRRNMAYYHHKRYEKQLEKLPDEEKTHDLKNFIIKKDERQCNTWQAMNQKLKDGFLYLRPTNKTVASILGICERQVSYYLNWVKNESLKKK